MPRDKLFLASSLALAVTVAALLVLSQSSVSNAAKTAPSDKAKVIVQELEASEDLRRLLVPAKVEAKVSSLVTAEAEGFVTRILKPLGSSVKAGEVVLYVENKDPAFTYAKVPVRSPVAGVVSQMSPALMSRVSRGDRLFVVIDPKALKVTAEIPGSDLALVRPGAAGAFQQSLVDKAGLPLRVVGVSPLVDTRTGTASAELEFALPLEKGKELPSIGTVGHALFEMSQGKVLLIPESALGYSEGKPMVRVLDEEGLVRRKPVELGEQKESKLVVRSGLAAGEKLIVRSSRSLKEGEAAELEASPKSN